MLRLTPKEFVTFSRYGGGNDAIVELTCISKYPIIFKIQTTSPEKFRVRPRYGQLIPNETVSVCIVLRSEFRLSEPAKDKFLIMSIASPDGETDVLSNVMTDIWRQKPQNSPEIEQHRLCCIYNDSVDANIKRNEDIDNMSYDERKVSYDQFSENLEKSLGLSNTLDRSFGRDNTLDKSLGLSNTRDKSLGLDNTLDKSLGVENTRDNTRDKSLGLGNTLEKSLGLGSTSLGLGNTSLGQSNTPEKSLGNFPNKSQGTPLNDLEKHANQLEKQLRCTQILQCLTLIFLLILSAAVVYLLKIQSGGDEDLHYDQIDETVHEATVQAAATLGDCPLARH